MTVNPKFSRCAGLLLKAALALSPAVIFPAQASEQTYKVSFSATSDFLISSPTALALFFGGFTQASRSCGRRSVDDRRRVR